MKTYLAVDIGASSGRHILGWLEDGKLKLKEIYRFKNGAEDQNGHLCWDIDRLESEVTDGIAACETVPESVAVDTWAVDYVLLGKNGERICPAVAYRDSRTETVPDELEKRCRLRGCTEERAFRCRSSTRCISWRRRKKKCRMYLKRPKSF